MMSRIAFAVRRLLVVADGKSAIGDAITLAIALAVCLQVWRLLQN